MLKLFPDDSQMDILNQLVNSSVSVRGLVSHFTSIGSSTLQDAFHSVPGPSSAHQGYDVKQLTEATKQLWSPNKPQGDEKGRLG
jgi:hypothetical protein